MPQKVYPRSKDKETVYLKSVISNPNIISLFWHGTVLCAVFVLHGC